MVFNLYNLNTILSYRAVSLHQESPSAPQEYTLRVYINSHLRMLPVELQDLSFNFFLVWQIPVCFKMFSILWFIKIPYFGYCRNQNNIRIGRNNGKGTTTSASNLRIMLCIQPASIYKKPHIYSKQTSWRLQQHLNTVRKFRLLYSQRCEAGRLMRWSKHSFWTDIPNQDISIWFFKNICKTCSYEQAYLWRVQTKF